MKTTAFAVAVATLLSFAHAHAQVNGSFGAGALMCSDYLSQRGSQVDRDVAAQWASGLIVGRLSAVGHYIPEALTVQEVANRLGAYCERNSEHALVLAALTLARDYQARP
jgi:hypothetical protein